MFKKFRMRVFKWLKKVRVEQFGFMFLNYSDETERRAKKWVDSTSHRSSLCVVNTLGNLHYVYLSPKLMKQLLWGLGTREVEKDLLRFYPRGEGRPVLIDVDRGGWGIEIQYAAGGVEPEYTARWVADAIKTIHQVNVEFTYLSLADVERELIGKTYRKSRTFVLLESKEYPTVRMIFSVEVFEELFEGNPSSLTSWIEEVWVGELLDSSESLKIAVQDEVVVVDFMTKSGYFGLHQMAPDILERDLRILARWKKKGLPEEEEVNEEAESGLSEEQEEESNLHHSSEHV